MIFAAIGGIHGNLPALEAVLEAIDEEGIQTIVNTGDCAVGHPWANETIALLRDRKIPTVQGEMDRRLVRARRKEETLREKLDPETFARLEEAFAACDSVNIEWLRGLPRKLTLTIDGVDIVLCHGTLTSQSQSLAADDMQERFQRQREVNPAPIIVCGRSAAPYAREVDGTLFVNPGLLGEGQSARYAIVSTEAEPYTAELRAITLPPAPARQ